MGNSQGGNMAGCDGVSVCLLHPVESSRRHSHSHSHCAHHVLGFTMCSSLFVSSSCAHHHVLGSQIYVSTLVAPWLRRSAEIDMDASSMGGSGIAEVQLSWPMLANLEQSFHYGRLHRYLRFCQDVRSSHVDLYGFRLLVRIRFASGSQRVRIWFASSHLVRIWFASGPHLV